MRRILVIVISSLIVATYPAVAQSLKPDFGIASSPNVVGSGARALGVGGAFIAIADDATAASWNPAALIVLERPEAAIMGSYENRVRNGATDFADFNYIAASYPFTAFKRNMIVSFNYQRLFDFNSNFDKTYTNLIAPQFTETAPEFAFTDPVYGFDVYDLNISTWTINSLKIKDKVTGDIGALAPAFAIQIIPKLSVGVTVNFWMDGIVNDGYSRKHEEFQSGAQQTDTLLWFDTNMDGVRDTAEWTWVDVDDNGVCNTPPDITAGNGDCIPDPGEGETRTVAGAANHFSSRTVLKSEYDFFGINANFGVLWNATSKITLGAVYKMPFTARVNTKTTYTSTETNLDTGEVTVTGPNEERGKYDLMFPAVYGLGFAYRLNDNFTAALDVAYTDWPSFKIKERIKTGATTPVDGPFGSGGEDFYIGGPTKSAVNGLNVEGYCDAREGPADCAPGDANFHRHLDIDGAFTARLGLEYLFILPKTIVPARLGFVYDPQPALGRPDDYFAVSTGTGIVLWQRLILDLAYQYRWSESATLSTVSDYNGTVLREINKGKVHSNTLMLSSIIHF